MAIRAGSRLGAGVLGALGGALAILIGLVLVILGGLMGAFASATGASVAVTGALGMFFGLTAAACSALFFLPWTRAAVVLVTLNVASMLWAFARIDAIGLAMVPVLPMLFAILLGVVAAARPDGEPAER